MPGLLGQEGRQVGIESGKQTSRLTLQKLKLCDISQTFSSCDILIGSSS